MAYKRGQEVLRDPKPFSYVVTPKYRKIVCDCCLKMCKSEGILRACAKCKWVYYCDQTCQKGAWKSHHKLECKYLQKQNVLSKNLKVVSRAFDEDFEDTPGTLLVLKLLKVILKLNKMKEEGKEEFFQLPNGKKRRFDDLVSNTDELRKQKEVTNDPNKLKLNHLYFIYKDFEIWLEDAIQIPTFTEFFEIYGKWQTNCTSIFALDFDDPFILIARGLYLGYSSLDHSCAPNAVWFNVGKEMIVRTIEDVNQYSDIRISCFYMIEKTHERKKYLQEHYFFDCKCVRCEDPKSDAKYSSLKCKFCSGWVPESTKICSSCNQRLKLNQEELTIVEKYKNDTLTKFEPTNEEIRSDLEKLTKVFHVFHEIFRYPEELFVFPKGVSPIQNGNHNDMLLLLEVRKLRMNHRSAYIPQYYQDFVFDHSEISNTCISLKLFDEAKSHLKKAEEIIKVVYGEDHPYMRDCQKRKMELLCACLSLK